MTYTSIHTGTASYKNSPCIQGFVNLFHLQKTGKKSTEFKKVLLKVFILIVHGRIVKQLMIMAFHHRRTNGSARNNRAVILKKLYHVFACFLTLITETIKQSRHAAASLI
jgi:hypothetical protein